MIVRFNRNGLPNIVVTDRSADHRRGYSVHLQYCVSAQSQKPHSLRTDEGRAACVASVGKTSFKIFDCVDICNSLEASTPCARWLCVAGRATNAGQYYDSETYKTIEADGRSFHAEHSHEQLVAKLQRIIGLATYNRDRSEAVDKHRSAVWTNCVWMRQARQLLAVWPRVCGKGPHWAPRFSIKLPGFIARLERLKTDINALRDAPFFLDIDDEVVSVKSLYTAITTRRRTIEAFDALVQHA